MRKFAVADRATQNRRLRRLAMASLPLFRIDARRVRVIHAAHNVTLSVLDHRGRRYAVRVYRSGWRTRTQIDSELAWLRALATDTEIGAPRPVGDAIEVTSDDLDGPRTIAAFSWVDGTDFNRSETPVGPEHARLLGRTAALLHAHASAWRPPQGFERPVCRGPGLTGDLAGLDAIQDPKQRDVVDRALTRCLPAFDRLDAAGSPFGLIHNDLHLGNVRVGRDRARPIDFDDSCLRHHAFDLSVAVDSLEHRPAAAATVDALLDGYTSVRPLPDGFEQELRHLLVAREIELVSPYQEDSPLRASSQRWIAAAVKKLELYAAGG